MRTIGGERNGVGTPEIDVELASYEKTSVVYGQIFELQRYLVSVFNFFIPGTAGIWSIASAGKLSLGTGPRIALLLLHMAGCVWLAAVLFGVLRSIRGRFILVDDLGERLFPRYCTGARGTSRARGSANGRVGDGIGRTGFGTCCHSGAWWVART
jgi:hypothetical protein